MERDTRFLVDSQVRRERRIGVRVALPLPSGFDQDMDFADALKAEVGDAGSLLWAGE